MANCSQINNITIKGTSAISYDSTPLPCTDIDTCDGLNTILAKFDAVICTAQSNVATLTENITNLTEDVMIITEDINNINIQLSVCCSTTTTTTTVYPYTCTCISISISQTDVDDATGNTPGPGKADNTVYLTSSKNSGCDGSDVAGEWTAAANDNFCIQFSELSSLQLFYYKNNVPIYFPSTVSSYTILYSNCAVRSDCT